MKRCPQCNRAYSNPSIKFCLNDGSPVVTTRDSEETLVMGDGEVIDVTDDTVIMSNASIATASLIKHEFFSRIVHVALCHHCEQSTRQSLLFIYEYVDDWSYLDEGVNCPCAYFFFSCQECKEIILYKACAHRAVDEWDISKSWNDPVRCISIIKAKEFTLIWPTSKEAIPFDIGFKAVNVRIEAEPAKGK